MTSKVAQFSIDSTYLVLGENGDSTPIPVSDRFFADLENKFGDFKGKRLVSHFTFTEDWDTWEMHPAGEEFVCLLWGQVDLILEQDEAENRICLSTPGAYVLIPRGIWHTVKVDRQSSMLFITPGQGTQNQARRQ